MNSLDVFAKSAGYQNIAPMWQHSLAIFIAVSVAVILLSPAIYNLLTHTVRTVEMRLKRK